MVKTKQHNSPSVVCSLRMFAYAYADGCDEVKDSNSSSNNNKNKKGTLLLNDKSYLE
jgi:hypothetical protein